MMFKIGDFAKLSRVSVKMLRHYAEIGLIAPAHIDADSGYRYYTADQLPRLNRILLLKDLGFSLETVGQIIESNLAATEIGNLLNGRRAEIIRQIDSQRHQLQQLDQQIEQLTTSGEWPMYDVIVRPIPHQMVATLTHGRAAGMPIIDQLFDEVEKAVADFHARAPRPPILLYDRDEIEIAIPINRGMVDSGRVKIAELAGAAHMACVIHTGNYGRLDQAKATLLTWVDQQPNITTAGRLREIFLRFGANEVGYELPEVYVTDSSAEFVTELQLPIQYS